jgi:hypothetical protein
MDGIVAAFARLNVDEYGSRAAAFVEQDHPAVGAPSALGDALSSWSTRCEARELTSRLQMSTGRWSRMMRRSGLFTNVGEKRVYHTIDEALRSLSGAAPGR